MNYIENNYADAKTGSVFVIPPFIYHGYYDGADLEIFHIALNKNFIDKFHTELHSFKYYSMMFEIEPVLRKSLKQEYFLQLDENELAELVPELNSLCHYEKLNFSGIITLKNAKALSIIGQLMYMFSQKNSTISNNENPSSQSIIAGVNFIHENYTEKIYMQQLADLCFMSFSTFSRKFKQIFDMSPGDYIMKLRIENAKTLLKETDKSMTPVAQDCGFFDLSHFTHYFKQFESCTPYQYKKRLSYNK